MSDTSSFLLSKSTAILVAVTAFAYGTAQAQASSQPQYHAPYLVYAQNVQPVIDSNPVTAPAQHINLPAAHLHSQVAYVYDLDQQEPLYEKNSYLVRPIASITKLMTAMVVLDAQLDLGELIEITADDIDTLKHTRSRLRVGSTLSRAELLHLALMSSENRAASALGRSYPGGLPAFVRAMNEKARALGMRQSQFVEPTGLSSDNLATAPDLAKMLQAAAQYPLIRKYSTSDGSQVSPNPGQRLQYVNTNRLVQNQDWHIQISKTGFINEAGRCLVMHTTINGRNLAVVLLNAQGRYSGMGDASRVRKAFERQPTLIAAR